MNNYPPGVTGNEPHVAGGEWVEVDIWCLQDGCDGEAHEVEVIGHYVFWTCPECEWENELSVKDVFCE